MSKTIVILGLGSLAAVTAIVTGDELRTPATTFEIDHVDMAVEESEIKTGNTDNQRVTLSSEQAAEASRSNILPAGTRSLMMLQRTMRHGDYVWNDQNIPSGPIHIWVDLRRQMISVFRGGHEIGTAVVVYGGTEGETPVGLFEVLSKHRHYRSRRYQADMPYSLFITNDGVALHGSVMEPRHATHGCIGLPEEFSRLLFEAVEVGAAVEVVHSDPSDVESLITS